MKTILTTLMMLGISASVYAADFSELAVKTAGLQTLAAEEAGGTQAPAAPPPSFQAVSPANTGYKTSCSINGGEATGIIRNISSEVLRYSGSVSFYFYDAQGKMIDQNLDMAAGTIPPYETATLLNSGIPLQADSCSMDISAAAGKTDLIAGISGTEKKIKICWIKGIKEDTCVYKCNTGETMVQPMQRPYPFNDSMLPIPCPQLVFPRKAAEPNAGAVAGRRSVVPAPEQLVIKPGVGVGNLKPGMTVMEIQNLFGKDHVEMAQESAEGSTYPVLNIYLDKTGDPALACGFSDENTKTIRNIEVFNPGYVVSGTMIRVGSPASLVTQRFKFDSVSTYETKIYATTSEGITFYFDKLTLSSDDSFSVPENAIVTSMVVYSY